MSGPETEGCLMGDRFDLWGGLPDRRVRSVSRTRKPIKLDDSLPVGRRLKGLDEFEPRHKQTRRSALLGVKPGLIALLVVSGITGILGWKSLQGTPSGYLLAKYTQSRILTEVRANAFTVDGGRKIPALAVSGPMGIGDASVFRQALDKSGLGVGDTVVLSSPGGSLDEGLSIGEEIRRRGLNTVVGRFDPSGTYLPSYCASACILAFAGGVNRIVLPGSMLGIHQFTGGSGVSSEDVSWAQRRSGEITGYLNRMGISPALFERMSQTRDVRWLPAPEASDLNLVTVRGE